MTGRNYTPAQRTVMRAFNDSPQKSLSVGVVAHLTGLDPG